MFHPEFLVYECEHRQTTFVAHQCVCNMGALLKAFSGNAVRMAAPVLPTSLFAASGGRTLAHAPFDSALPCSMLEVYNEALRDLLQSEAAKPLDVSPPCPPACSLACPMKLFAAFSLLK